MTHLDPKGKGTVACQKIGDRVQMTETVRREVLRDTAKSGLPEAQSPVDERPIRRKGI
jgi:hypothetical protein